MTNGQWFTEYVLIDNEIDIQITVYPDYRPEFKGCWIWVAYDLNTEEEMYPDSSHADPTLAKAAAEKWLKAEKSRRAVQNIDTKAFEKAVKDFCDAREYEVYNVAHLVLDDKNFEDSSIQFVLKWIEANRDEYARVHSVTQDQIQEVVGFLNWMLSVPEDVRCPESEE